MTGVWALRTRAGAARLQCSWAKAILKIHVGYSPNSLKEGYTGAYLGEYGRGY